MTNLTQLTKGNELLINATYEILVISPLKEIIEKLNSNEYRDSDIQYLKDIRAKYVELAMTHLNIKIKLLINADYSHLNEHVTNMFVKHFSIILKYFSQFQ